MGDQGTGKMSLPPDIHSEIVNHSDHGVIINGVISWIIAQKETNAPEIWKNIALQHYNESEIKEAWKEMSKMKEKLKVLGLDLKTFKKSAKAEIEDIDEAVNILTEANCMPLVMASSSMILRAPIFWGKDKGDDIAGVAAELKELKVAMVSFMKQNEKQIDEIKQDIVTAIAPKPKVATRVQPLNPAKPLAEGEVSQRTRFNLEDEVEVIENEYNEEDFIEVSYATKAATKNTTTAAEALVSLLTKSKNESKKKSDKPKMKVIYGSSKSEVEGDSMAADISLVAFNINKTCSKEAMKTFISEKGIDVVDVTDMTREEVMDNVKVKTMKVVVKATEYEKAMDPGNWPCRVGVRLWKDKEAQKARFDRWQVRQEQIRSRKGGDKEVQEVRPRNVKHNQTNCPEGGRKNGKLQKSSHSENRYEGNIFEELLRQVLRA